MAECDTSTVDYEFKVRITDQDTRPTEGLQVNLSNGRGDKREPADTQGNVELEGSYTGFRGDHGVALEVKDIDGGKNSVVADKRVIADIKESDFVNKDFGGWNNGKVKKDIEI